jgi:hypothetical protein
MLSDATTYQSCALRTPSKRNPQLLGRNRNFLALERNLLRNCRQSSPHDYAIHAATSDATIMQLQRNFLGEKTCLKVALRRLNLELR